MQQVQPLIERDAKAASDQPELARTALQTIMATIKENKKAVADKNKLIPPFHETIAVNS